MGHVGRAFVTFVRAETSGTVESGCERVRCAKFSVNRSPRHFIWENDENRTAMNRSSPAAREPRCDDGSGGGAADGSEKTRRVRWHLAEQMNCCAEQDCEDPDKAYENVLGGNRKCVCEDRKSLDKEPDGCDDDEDDADDEADDESQQAERQDCDDVGEEKKVGNGNGSDDHGSCSCGGGGESGGGGGGSSDKEQKRLERRERQRQRKEARRERENRLRRKLDAERKRADTLQCAWEKIDEIRQCLDDELATS